MRAGTPPADGKDGAEPLLAEAAASRVLGPAFLPWFFAPAFVDTFLL